MTIIGALFDSSRQLINGPTNAISIAVLSVIGAIATPETLLSVVVLLTFMVGAVQLGITLFRLGDLTRYISHSVIVGFTLGVGSLLVIDQMKNLLGMKAMGDPHDNLLYRFWLTMTGVAVIMLVAAPYAHHLPRAALAGILVVASYGMVDWQALRIGDLGRVLRTGGCADVVCADRAPRRPYDDDAVRGQQCARSYARTSAGGLYL
jgi:MFS superfamily sulfate permease-like transporter